MRLAVRRILPPTHRRRLEDCSPRAACFDAGGCRTWSAFSAASDWASRPDEHASKCALNAHFPNRGVAAHGGVDIRPPPTSAQRPNRGSASRAIEHGNAARRINRLLTYRTVRLVVSAHNFEDGLRIFFRAQRYPFRPASASVPRLAERWKRQAMTRCEQLGLAIPALTIEGVPKTIFGRHVDRISRYCSRTIVTDLPLDESVPVPDIRINTPRLPKPPSRPTGLRRQSAAHPPEPNLEEAGTISSSEAQTNLHRGERRSDLPDDDRRCFSPQLTEGRACHPNLQQIECIGERALRQLRNSREATNRLHRLSAPAKNDFTVLAIMRPASGVRGWDKGRCCGRAFSTLIVVSLYSRVHPRPPRWRAGLETSWSASPDVDLRAMLSASFLAERATR